jgi:hypothetical protein
MRFDMEDMTLVFAVATRQRKLFGSLAIQIKPGGEARTR